MRVALLTIWHEKNYGAEMQAYATIRALRQLGHEVQMIDLRLDDMRKFSIKGRIAGYIKFITPCEWKFRHFWAKNIATTERYRTIKQLKDNPPEADVYLVGSDQVWNPDIVKEFLPAFFLNFGKQETARVSYASSFGCDTWQNDETITAQIKKNLYQFNAVSCREESGCVILKNNFDVEAKCVIDPTLLHENYNELCPNIVESATLVYYPLTNDPELERYAASLANRLNLRLVNATNPKRMYGKIMWNRNSPKEWIRTIAGSQIVITRSFHGVAFSIIYKRQFMVVNNSRLQTRISNLLSKLGLSNRLFSSFEEVDKAQPWLSPIDYQKITPLLAELRESSMEYLKSISTLR